MHLLLPLLPVLACSGEAAETAAFVADAVVSEAVPTVATVTFEVEGEGTVWVEWGLSEDARGHSTVPGTSEGPEHTVLVGGMPPDSTLHARAFYEADGERMESDVFEVHTGSAPTSLPKLHITQQSAPTVNYTLSLALGQSASAFVLNPEGQMVWWYEAGEEYLLNQAHLSESGTEVWINRANRDFGIDSGAIYRVRIDGTVLDEITTPLAHHDFVVLPDDAGIAYLAIDVRDVDGMSVVGDAVIERAPDGTTRTVWSTFDTFDPTGLDPAEDTEFYTQGYDWTHANSLTYDAGTDSYIVSLHQLSTVVDVERSTGSVQWSMGELGTMEPVGLARDFIQQHSPRLTPEGTLMLFDNGAHDTTGAYSRALELVVDPEANTYQEIWGFDDHRSNVTYLLGDETRLPSGNTLVSWGNVGMMTEVNPEGDVVWRASSDIGFALGFHSSLQALGGVP